MAVTNGTMTVDESGAKSIFQLPISISKSGETSVVLDTEEQYLDKNIGITITTPDAGTFNVSNISGSSDVSVGTLADGKYPITANNLSVTAAMSSAGWVGTGNLTDSDTDNCTVGKMAAAAASVSASVAAPTIEKVTQAVTSKTQILNSVDPATGTSGISKYYIAVKGKSGAVTQGSPSVGTAGYLTAASQITANGVAAGNQTSTYYIPVPTAAASVAASVAAPTIEKVTQAVSGKTQILSSVDPTTATSGITTYYVAIKGFSGAVTQGTPAIGTAGYIDTASQITASGVSAKDKSATYYIPVPTAAFTVSNNKVYCSAAGYVPQGSTDSVVGTVSTGTISNNQDSMASGASSSGTLNRGKYIKIGAGYYDSDRYYQAQTNSGNKAITASGSTNVDGYATVSVSAGTITNNISGGTSAGTINRGSQIKIGAGFYAADTYYTAQANSGTVTITSSGNTSVDGKVTATVAAASFANTATNGVTYTDYDSSAPELKSGDCLYINAGYTPARKISLAKLVPNEATVGAAETSAHILTGHSAYNIDGKIVAGSMTVYAGAYTITT